MPINGKLKFDDLVFFVALMFLVGIVFMGIKVGFIDKIKVAKNTERIAVQEELQTQIMQDIYAELTKWNS